MGTFMSKHCSPVSYGTPLEKKGCSAANYGSPLDQQSKELKDKPKVKVHQKKVLVEPNLTENVGLLRPTSPYKQGFERIIRYEEPMQDRGIIYDRKTPKQVREEQSSMINYGTPLNQFQEQASAKEAPSVAVRQKSTIINPNFAKLTQKQKDSLHKKAMDAGKVIYSEKFKVEVDPEDGVLQRMKNPNYKK